MYVKHTPGQKQFSDPVNVLREASGMAASFNMTVGKDGRVHVFTRPNPKYSKKEMGAKAYDAMFKSKARFFVLRYMLHSRLNDDGSAFEDETNIIGKTIGFEGAGAIVADQNSAKVYAFWPGQTEPGPELGVTCTWLCLKTKAKTGLYRENWILISRATADAVRYRPSWMPRATCTLSI